MKISKSTHSLVQIVTQQSVTDVDLKSWTPTARGCYYLNEKWLKDTKIYSYINCYVECQVNITNRLCGCSPIFRISIKDINEPIDNYSCINYDTPKFFNRTFKFQSYYYMIISRPINVICTQRFV